MNAADRHQGGAPNGAGEASGTRVYRGRSLEELIPRIKDELGSEAVILRQRDGLAGGIGGFFQRQFVEVEAHAGDDDAPATSPPRPAASGRLDLLDDAPAGPEPYADRPPDAPGAGLFERTPPVPYPPRPAAGPDFDPPSYEPMPPPEPPAAGDREVAADRDMAVDRDMAEGLRAPGIRTMLDQAAPFAGPGDGGPFARELASAGRRQTPPADPPERAETSSAIPGTSPVAAAGERRAERPAEAEALERRMVEAGLPAALAAELIAETVSHRAPFGADRDLRSPLRNALAARIPTRSVLGAGGRSIACVGAGGAGKTLCAARLAAAYQAGGDLPVVCLALDADDGGSRLAALVAEAGIEARAVDSVEAARAWLRASAQDALVVVDTPGVTPLEPARVTALGRRLRRLGVEEVHLILPATVSAAAGRDLIEGLGPLLPDAIALTHADETAHVGAAVALAVETGMPLSYVGRGTALRGGLELADAAALAAWVLP